MEVLKAKDFWDYLCNDLNYRFFSGVPCKGLKPLYDTMNSEIMYYVPAVNELIALGLASGVGLSGDKAGILLHEDSLHILKNALCFNNSYELPILFIVYSDRADLNTYNMVKTETGLGQEADFKKVLKRVDNYITKNKKSKILVITEGVL